MPKKQKQTEVVSIRIEPSVRDRLEVLCDAWSMTMSGAIRRLIIEATAPKDKS